MGDDDPYSIPHSNVLKNKLGITQLPELDKAERLLTSVRIHEVPPLSTFSLDEYLNIHKVLFQDIYSWAGQPRHKMPVFSGVGSDLFKPLSEGLHDIDKTLKGLAFGAQQLAMASVEQFSEVAARVFCVINKAHVFREGNGRAQRVYLAKLAMYFGYSMNIQELNGPAWNIASILACQGDYSYLNEQILFSLRPRAFVSLQKAAVKDKLLTDYHELEALAEGQNSAGFEYNADKIVANIVTGIGYLDGIKTRFNVEVSDNVPRLLIAQLLNKQVL